MLCTAHCWSLFGVLLPVCIISGFLWCLLSSVFSHAVLFRCPAVCVRAWCPGFCFATKEMVMQVKHVALNFAIFFGEHVSFLTLARVSTLSFVISSLGIHAHYYFSEWRLRNQPGHCTLQFVAAAFTVMCVLWTRHVKMMDILALLAVNLSIHM